MSAELAQADREAMLVAEAAALSVIDPSIWDHYMNGWKSDVKRRIDERFPNAGAGNDGSGSGELPVIPDAPAGGS